MTDLKDYGIAALTGLLGLVGYFSKRKVDEIDRQLQELDEWKKLISVNLGEFKQVQKQLETLHEDQRTSLIILNDLRNALIRVNNEERRH